MSLLRYRFTAAAFAAATFLLLACASALAAEKPDAEPKKPAPPAQPSYGEDTPLNLPDDAPKQFDATGASSSSSIVRTFVGLAVVIGVIYGLYWILRQVKTSREERSSGSGLASQAVVPLGPNRSLHLVRAGSELVLLGVAEHGVTPIRRYTEEEARAIGLIGADRDDDAPSAPSGVPGAKPSPMTIGQLVEKVRQKTVRA
jgi:flagellar protein FliO/FliZ